MLQPEHLRPYQARAHASVYLTPFHETLGLVCLHDVYSTRATKREYGAAQNLTHTHTRNYHVTFIQCIVNVLPFMFVFTRPSEPMVRPCFPSA